MIDRKYKKLREISKANEELLLAFDLLEWIKILLIDIKGRNDSMSWKTIGIFFVVWYNTIQKIWNTNREVLENETRIDEMDTWKN